jgi:hypothetical protein
MTKDKTKPVTGDIEPKKIGRPLKIDSKAFKRATDEYLQECIDNKTVPFLQGLAQKLNIDTDTITSYGKLQRYTAQVKRVRQASENALIQRGLESGKPIMPIFLLKSLFSYQEQAKLDITSNGETIGVVALPANPDKSPHR